MADYYIETANGKKGPYPEAKIVQGVREGKVPHGAKLTHALTGDVSKAGELAKTSAGSFNPTEPYRADGQQAQQYQQPQRHPNQPSQPQQQQPAYPQQQPAYPQQQPAYPPQQPAYPPQQQYAQPQYPQSQYPQQYSQPGFQQPYGGQQQQYYPQAQQTSTLAILALVLTLATIPLSCLPAWIGGIICGVMALKEVQPNGPKKGRGMALAGIWVGVAFAVLTVLGIAAIVIDETSR